MSTAATHVAATAACAGEDRCRTAKSTRRRQRGRVCRARELLDEAGADKRRQRELGPPGAWTGRRRRSGTGRAPPAAARAGPGARGPACRR